VPKKQSSSREGSRLREAAEKLLAEKPASKQSYDDPDRLIHELQVHQIELEMQNQELRRVQLEIEESHKEYRDLYDFAPVGYLTLTDKGMVSGLNLAAAEFLGIERKTHINTGFSRYIQSEFQDTFYHHLQKVRESSRKQTCELGLKKNDGTMFYVQLNSISTETKGQRVIASTLSDITERKRMEESLRLTNDRLNLAQTEAKAGVWDWDILTGHIVWSDQIFDLFGLDPAKAPASFDAWRSALHPEDVEVAGLRIENALKDKTVLNSDYRIVLPDGQIRWINAVGKGDYAKDGSAIRMIGVCIDITDRKKAEEALRESEERYRIAIEGSIDGVTLVKNDLHVYVNQSFLDMFGYRSANEIVGKPRSDTIHPDDRERVAIYASARQNGEDAPTRYEFKGIRKDGTPIDVEVSANLIYYRGEKASLAYLRDITDRKKTEDMLRESQRFLEETQKIARLGGWKANPHTDYLEWTKGVYDIIESPYDYRPGLTEGLKFYSPESVPLIQAGVTKCLATGEPFAIECEALTTTGKKLWVEVRGLAPVIEGTRSFVMGTFQDITDRKRAEEINSRLAAIVQSSADAIIGTDLGGIVTSWNKGAEDIYGYAESEIIGKLISILAPLDLQDEVPKILTKVRLGERIENRETVRRRKDGHDIHVSLTISPILDTEGRIVAASTIVRDITDRKQAEEALRESEQRLRTLMDAAPVAITLADMEGNRKYINRKHYELFGYTLEEIPTLSEWRKRAYPDPAYREKVPNFFTGCKEGKEFAPFEATITCKDGSQRHVIGSAAAASNMALLILNDITERKNLESELQQSQKMEAIGHLAGGVAHDFNNILTAIIGFGSLIEMDVNADNPHRPYIEEILRAAERAARLTDSLLAYSRKQFIQPVPLNLNDSIEYQRKLLGRLIGEDIRVITKLSMDPLVIVADPGQVDQVVMNIVTNARDAMPKGGTITIATMLTEMDDVFIASQGYGTPGAHALITISDTGTGMDEGTLQKIFNPFFTTKEVGKGTGLGLSVVYGIVKQNNGYIDVESQPGKGTTFLIYFPVVALESPSEERRTSELIEGHETILVCEDEEAVRLLTRTVLERAGYTVLEAPDGAAALRIFQENIKVIDLVILDVVMPGMNGKEVYDSIKRLRPEQKVLFNSGYTDDIVATKGILEDKLAFISKPLRPVDFLNEVRRVLDS
jgi:two-component system, cell cycle sensor histidine kinase and response regulator CckA